MAAAMTFFWALMQVELGEAEMRAHGCVGCFVGRVFFGAAVSYLVTGVVGLLCVESG